MLQDTQANNNPSPNRDMIAGKIILWSGVGILTVSVLLIVASVVPVLLPAVTDKKQAVEDMGNHVGTVFNALLPLFGTWVGTVLAYYFSKDNFQAATNATQSLLAQMDAKLDVSINTAWIPYDQIKGINLASGDNPETQIKAASLLAMLSRTVTRIPVFDDKKAIKYLVHESLLFRYYTLSGTPKDDANKTLKDLLDYDDTAQKAKVFAVMAPNGTLADAKARMESVDGAQDVFVTSHGGNQDPVLGWITNSVLVASTKS